MAVKQTIAFIGAPDKLSTVLVKKLAEANYPLLLVSNDGYQYQQLAEQIKNDTPNADIEISDCAKKGCWEADIVALFDTITLEEKLFEKIKVVATQKIVLSISASANETFTSIKTKELRQMLPNSKVIQLLYNDPAELELLVAGEDEGAINLVSTLFENAGFVITEKV